MNGICRLCESETTLNNSHIIPKSIYRWIKKTSGTGVLRKGKDVNQITQDGPKRYLLCRDCEQKFGKYEKYFFEKVFKPVAEGEDIGEFEYSEKMFYFINSIWWRIIHLLVDSNDEELIQSKYYPLLVKCENELKLFLRDFLYPRNFDDTYLLLLGRVQSAPEEFKNINFFCLRTTDIHIMFDDDSCYFYLRIPNFNFFGNIMGLDSGKLGANRINPSGGLYTSSGKNLQYEKIGSFIGQRINVLNEQMDKISDNQLNKTTERHRKKINEFMDSKSFEAWIADRDREN